MFVYFLTGFYAFSLSHLPVHVATHVLFLLTGCLYCWQIICADPVRKRLTYPRRLAYAAAGLPLTAIIAMLLMTRASSIASEHPLADTHAGGLVLLVAGEVIALAEVAYVASRWQAYKERSAARLVRSAARLGLGAGARRAGASPAELSRAPVRDSLA